ncbi:hypothetical protein PZ895_02355 [Mesorhizobium sp. YIM 152430]|uniref:hypothetical protein n=1 Tax=Mesorhizobium sp. YIM 152430 TaxID=3031761 RepID=UPI0023DC92C5|nr:hypothetical protein [Mesorhizobium sp. YIM 152430]MDF1598617.1 hypothetical protein [Mesorhizobium sp. YIM 152430]
MPRVRGKLSSKGVALVAAYMLVLQALFGSFASGAAAGTAILDDFGNPLCITSHVPGPSGGEGRDHSGLPDCCAPGCSMFAPVTLGDREPHALSNPLTVSFAVAIAAPTIVAAGKAGREPGNPRAPPLAA